jgi:DUF4097 and DUF4098 domain-containing protein YvlB
MNAPAARFVLTSMKQQSRQGVACVGAVAMALAVAACDVKVGDQGMSFDVTQGRANDEWTRTYALPKGGTLAIDSGGGPVYLVPADDANVEIRIIRQAQARSDEAAQGALKEETISEDVSADRVLVKTERRASNVAEPFGRRRISTEFRVKIPPGLHVDIKGENADITLTNVQGTFTLENVNAGFRARGVSGPVTATTVNGIVDFEFADLVGEVRATTVNGPVLVGLPAEADATLEAMTVNGVVNVDEQLRFAATERQRQKVSGTINGGGSKVVLQTTNGPVRVRVAGQARGPRRGDEPVVLERQLESR